MARKNLREMWRTTQDSSFVQQSPCGRQTGHGIGPGHDGTGKGRL